MLALAALIPQLASAQEPSHSIYLNTGRLDTSAPVALRQAAAFTGQQAYLIQFTGPIQTEWHTALRQTGVRVLSYLPDNAYLIYGDAAAIARAQSLAPVRWHGAYQVAHKVHPKARQNLSAEFAIQLVDDAGANAATFALLEQLKLAPLHRQTKSGAFIHLVAQLWPADLDTLAAQPDVISVRPFFAPQKHDERQSQIIAGNLTGSVPSGPGYLAWLASKGFTQSQFDTSGFVVDLSDSGVDNGTAQPGHFGLYPAGNINATSRVAYNRLEGSPNPSSTLAGCDGHGNLNTHIVAGYDNQSSYLHRDAAGYSYGLGVCPFVHVGSSVVFDPDNWTYPDVPTLISDAYQSGARISNNSWGDTGSGGDYNSDSQLYDSMVRGLANQEMILVFSAGNDGPTTFTITPPGTAKNVITVGASENVRSLSTANGGNNTAGQDGCTTYDTDANSANDVVDFSSRGPCNDGRFKPDLVAPGTHIIAGAPQSSPPPTPSGTGAALSCFLANGDGVCGLLTSRNVGGVSNFFPIGQQFFVESSGTSHSAPAVSGACALLRQYFINQALTPPSPAMTKAYLINSARYLTGVYANDTLPSPSQGMGELNLGMAFDGTVRLLRDQVPVDKFTATGQTRTFTGAILDATKPFRVTLAWTDAPGSTMTGKALNNDLDLTVTIGGQTYYGNVFVGANSTTGGSADRLNNVESIFLPAGTTGSFTVTVTAHNINSAAIPDDSNPLNQDFALVVYNAGNAGLAIATPSPLPAGEIGVAYSGALNGSGGTPPYTWTLISGNPPAGLTLNSDGTLTGTPTADGTSTFTVRVTDNVAATATGNFSLTIQPPPVITTASVLPAGEIGAAYVGTFTGSDGTPPYTWKLIAGNLPAGLALNKNGIIYGTPTAVTNTSFTVQVTDSFAVTGSNTFSLTIQAGPTITTTNPLPDGALRTVYSTTLQATSGTAPYTWKITAGTLPSGLRLSSAGVITGTPSTIGTNRFTVQVTDRTGATATAIFNITVNTGLTVATPRISPAGGTNPDYVKVTLSCSTSQSVLRYTLDGSTPTAISTKYTAALTLSNSVTLKTKAFRAFYTDSAIAAASFLITTPVITTASMLPSGSTTQNYSKTLQATGGATPYQWKLLSGSLPAGMRLSSGGALSGKPTATGIFNFTIQVTDNRKGTGQQAFSLQVN